MSSGVLMGLDIGSKRIGVALARADVRIPQPLATLDASDNPLQQIADLIIEHDVRTIVTGWPRGLAGQATEQTKTVETFVAELRAAVAIPVELQDEALTSQKAEAELATRRRPYAKEDVDALAATYILEDYLQEHLPERSHV